MGRPFFDVVWCDLSVTFATGQFRSYVKELLVDEAICAALTVISATRDEVELAENLSS